jgi:hypothetical protein
MLTAMAVLLIGLVVAGLLAAGFLFMLTERWERGQRTRERAFGQPLRLLVSRACSGWTFSFSSAGGRIRAYCSR